MAKRLQMKKSNDCHHCNSHNSGTSTKLLRTTLKLQTGDKYQQTSTSEMQSNLYIHAIISYIDFGEVFAHHRVMSIQSDLQQQCSQTCKLRPITIHNTLTMCHTYVQHVTKRYLLLAAMNSSRSHATLTTSFLLMSLLAYILFGIN